MKNQPYDIHKAAGIIIRDRQVLAVRSKDSTIFVPPGGKLEPGETEDQALIRELQEELGIVVQKPSLEKMGEYYAEAAGKKNVKLKLTAFLVNDYEGQPRAQNEIAELKFFTSSMPDGVEVALILRYEIIPELVRQNLIN